MKGIASRKMNGVAVYLWVVRNWLVGEEFTVFWVVRKLTVLRRVVMAMKSRLSLGLLFVLALVGLTANSGFAAEEIGIGDVEIERALFQYDPQTRGFQIAPLLPAGFRGLAPQIGPVRLRGDFFQIERGMKADAIFRNRAIMR